MMHRINREARIHRDNRSRPPAGLAVGQHGWSDLDVLVSAETENLIALRDALADLRKEMGGVKLGVTLVSASECVSGRSVRAYCTSSPSSAMVTSAGSGAARPAGSARSTTGSWPSWRPTRTAMAGDSINRAKQEVRESVWALLEREHVTEPGVRGLSFAPWSMATRADTALNWENDLPQPQLSAFVPHGAGCAHLW
jgi:hypothetical protein